MKLFLKILTVLWIILCPVLGVCIFLDTPNQIKRDKEFINEKIKPAVEFIKNFEQKNHRLPTKKEYYIWEREYYNDYSVALSEINEIPDSLLCGRIEYVRNINEVVSNDKYKFKFKNVNWKKDYAIAVWRGEWFEYYFSWSDSYDGANHSWFEGIIFLIESIGIGIFPLLFWIYYNKRNKKVTSNVYKK